MKNEIEKSATENMQLALPQNEMLTLYSSASSLKLTDEENTKISAIFSDDLIEIRPDGHIYLPQSYYRNRLNESVGIGQWGLIPKGSHQEINGGKTKLFFNGVLVIRGCFVAEAVGEAELHSTNENQSIATVWESAKSDCITRCCKDLSIAKQIYEPAFVRRWQKEYAVQVWVEDKNKPQWRRTDSPPFFKEKGPVEANKPFPFQHPDKVLRWLNEKTQSGGVTGDWLRVTKDLVEGKTTISELQKEFKISRPTEDRLRDVLAEAKAASKQSAPAQKISGEWYAKLEKCKCKEDVDALGTENATVINANPALRKLFVDTKAGLPAKEKLDLSTKHELQN